MALQADLLESIPQTRYLSADSYVSYRAIMRTFYLEYQKCAISWIRMPFWPCCSKTLFCRVYCGAADTGPRPASQVEKPDPYPGPA